MFDNFFKRLLHLAKAPKKILLDELLKTVLLHVQPYFQNWILVTANSKKLPTLQLLQETLLSQTPTLLAGQLLEILRQDDWYFHFDALLNNIMRSNKSIEAKLICYFIGRMVYIIDEKEVRDIDEKETRDVKTRCLLNTNFFKYQRSSNPRQLIAYLLNKMEETIPIKETIPMKINVNYRSANAKAQEILNKEVNENKLNIQCTQKLFPYIASLNKLKFWEKKGSLPTVISQNLRANSESTFTELQQYLAYSFATKTKGKFDDSTLDDVVRNLSS